MTAADCIREAIGLVHGLAFLAGVVCGFVLCVGFGVNRKLKLSNAEHEKDLARLRRANGELMLIDEVISQEVYGVPPGETTVATNSERVRRALKDFREARR